MPRERKYNRPKRGLTAYPETRDAVTVPGPEVMAKDLFKRPPKNDLYRTHYGRSLTLDRIQKALLSAQDGFMRDLTDMSRETVGLDPHLASVLYKRLNAVASLPWECRPAEGPGVDEIKAQAYAEFATEQLKMVDGLRQSLVQLAWGLFDGRAALEIHWVDRPGTFEWKSDGNKKTVTLPIRWRAGSLAWLHPRRLCFDEDRNLYINDTGMGTGFSKSGVGLADVPFKFIHFTPQLFGDYPELEGLAPKCLYWSFMKRFGARERMVLLELFGKPWRIVTVDEESESDHVDINEAGDIADQLGNTVSARMPRGTKLEVVQNDPRAAEAHEKVIETSDKQLSKLVLGQTGTTDAQPGALGGGLQSVIMSNEQFVIMNGDAAMLSEAIEDYLTDAIIELNFGHAELINAPRFVLRAETSPDKKIEAERMKIALDMGLPIEIDEAYDVLGFKKPEPGSIVLQVTSTPGPMGTVERSTKIIIAPEELTRQAEEFDKALKAASEPEPVPGAPVVEPANDPAAPKAAPTNGAAGVIKEVLGLTLGRSDLQVKLEISNSVALPFAGYEDFDACLLDQKSKGHSDEEAQNICGALKRDHEAASTEAELIQVSRDFERLLLAELTIGHSHGDHEDIDRAALANNRQPESIHGTLETLIDKGVREGARGTNRWGEALASAVRGKTKASDINRALQQAADRLDLLQFARTIERRMTHSSMTGSLDSQWEDQSGDQIAPEKFSEPETVTSERARLAAIKDVSPDFTSMAYKNALQFFKSKQPIPKSAFERLSSAAKARSFTVAGLTSEHLIKVAQSELANAIVEGTKLSEFSARLTARFESAGMTPLNSSHVETIFRTNLVTSYNVGRKAEMTQPDALRLRPYWLIRTVKDDRQRDTHRAVDGWVLRASDPFWRSTGGPPFGFNCFTPGTRIAGEVIGAARSLYRGKGCQVTTAKGARLTVTANHPILTERGFLPAHAIRKGNKLVCHDRQIHMATTHHEHDPPPFAEELFATLREALGSCRTKPMAGDFHGEAERFNGEVEVVGSYGTLLSDYQTPRPQQLGKFDFMSADSFALAGGSRGKSGSAVALATPGSMCSTDLLASPIATHAGPFDALRVGLIAQFHPALLECTTESIATDLELVRELVQRDPAAVLLDEVVDVAELDLDGHVYDFETRQGWLVADGIMASNCRCRLTTIRAEKLGDRQVRSGAEIMGLPDPGFDAVPL